MSPEALMALIIEKNDALKQLADLEPRLTAVVNLHRRAREGADGQWCEVCIEAWPCRTVKLAKGEPE